MSTLGLHRKGDKDTSVAAARHIAERLTDIQQEVLNYARARGALGFTDLQLSEAFYCRASTYRTRRAELTAKGLIIDDGSRRSTRYPSGTTRCMVIWKHKDFV